jgi:hypothetical protein
MTLPRMAPRRMSRPRLRLEQIDQAAQSRYGFDPEGSLRDMNGPTDAHARVGN